MLIEIRKHIGENPSRSIEGRADLVQTLPKFGEH